MEIVLDLKFIKPRKFNQKTLNCWGLRCLLPCYKRRGVGVFKMKQVFCFVVLDKSVEFLCWVSFSPPPFPMGHFFMVESLLKKITQRHFGSERPELHSWHEKLSQAHSIDCVLRWKMMMDAQKKRSTVQCKDKCLEETAPVWLPGKFAALVKRIKNNVFKIRSN